jgi:hypothetical protein
MDNTHIPTAASSAALASDGACSDSVRDAAGNRIEVTLPYSEVCMYMGVAGKRMLVEPVGQTMAQLIDPETGSLVSFPITRGEAGLQPCNTRNGFCKL